MYSTLPDYRDDLNKVKKLLDLSDSVKEMSAISLNSNDSSDPFINNAIKLNKVSKENRANLVVLNGTLLLYAAGKFENFVRTTFEELCTNLADKADRYSYLPKDMRENLIVYTAQVIANPRKYGHADLGVKSFVKTLADNLVDESDLTNINANCLSITSENMRPQILADLFKRIGIKNIWEKISQQAKLQVFFELSDNQAAKREAEKFLNKLMDTRNGIAHPTSSFSWPDPEYVRKSIDYLDMLGEVLNESLTVFQMEISQKIDEARVRNSS